MSSLPASPPPTATLSHTALALDAPALQALRDAYRRDKAALLAQLQEGGGASTRNIHSLLRRFAALADGLLRSLWRRADLPAEMALLAVGGYGRAQLFPHSDIDVLLLLPHGCSPECEDGLRARIERFVGSCWDVGLEIGSSVRTVAQCLAEAAQDVTVQTSLLEARWLCGSRALCDEFEQQFGAQIDPRAFFTAKTLEMRQRYTKYENTPYALEPNCKESPGGLRDLQLIQWVARAAGLGRSPAS